MAIQPTVLIYGFDGFDPDVTANLFSLYRSLGLRPFSSRHFVPADVLCIERTPLDAVAIPHYSAIHVFDYVCSENQAFMKSIEGRDATTIFYPSDRRMSETVQAVPGLAPQGTVLLPPVAVDHWISRGARTRPNMVVHVGNFKPYYSDGTDLFADRFLQGIRETGAMVWGRNWTNSGIDKEAIRGRAPLGRVSGIYARSRVGLGMMYPYQRDRSISGRFWQGPLNGTIILSEPNSLISSIPGVVETDYSHLWNDVRNAIHVADTNDIANSARRYWAEHLSLAQTTIAQSMSTVEAGLGRDRRAKEGALYGASSRDLLRTIRRRLLL